MPLAGLLLFHINNHNHETILLGSTHAIRQHGTHRAVFSSLPVNVAFKDEIAPRFEDRSLALVRLSFHPHSDICTYLLFIFSFKWSTYTSLFLLLYGLPGLI